MKYTKWIFAVVAVCGFLVALRAPVAHAEERGGCQQNIQFQYKNIPNSSLENYESVEYINGYLVIHFRFSRQLVRDDQWFPRVIVLDDQCREVQFGAGSALSGNIMPTLPRNASLRFAPDGSYKYWNDDIDAPLACDSTRCSGKLPIVPDFFIIRLSNQVYTYPSNTGETLSSGHYLKEQGRSSPIQTATIPPPTTCYPFEQKSSTGIIDDYERARYVNGLLQIQFRRNMAVTDFTFGNWGFHMLFTEPACFQHQLNIGNRNTIPFSTRLLQEYFSIRFTSSTHYEWWDDDLEIPMGCPECSGDLGSPITPLPSGSPEYLAVDALHFKSTPYLIREPLPGNSSVIFIPGITGSRLYVKENNIEKRLWEPDLSSASRLYMDNTGKSILDGVYSKDVIDELTYKDVRLSNIYKSFMDMMDGMVTDKTIKEWKALPYDWRYDYEKIITDGDFVKQVEEMAGRSDTGKVTIIAHSNGGLIAKELISRLEEKGEAELVDKLVLVAVPQMGTPKALDVLLHGESVGFVKKFFVPKAVSRRLAEYSQAAFNLLPTENYFAKVIDPVIEFDTASPLTADWRTKYGNSITSAIGMRNFLAGNDGREKPDYGDVISPNVLLQKFIDVGAERAISQDSWVPPTGLKIIQIAGWGLDTLRGIRYSDKIKNTCNADVSLCLPKRILTIRPENVIDGDGSVISYSASEMDAETYYVDLQKYNKTLKRIGRDHTDILEIQDVLNTLGNLFLDSTIGETQYLTSAKPLGSRKGKRLSVHSPVSIDVYDSAGNHTGLLPNENPDSDTRIIEEQIPNSSYMEFGEGKYVTIPDDGAYTTVIKGTGAGTFTLE